MARIYFIKCRDAGVDCDFEARGSQIEDVIERCAEHATSQHGMKAFSPELYAKMRACLKVIDEPAPQPNPTQV